MDKAYPCFKYKKGGESLEQKERIVSFNLIIKEDTVYEKNKRLSIDIP